MNLDASHDYSAVFDGIFAVAGVACVAAIIWGIGNGAFGQFVALVALIVLAVEIYAIFVEPNRLSVASYREALVAEPKTWIKIALLTDLHAGGFRKKDWYERVVNEVNALAPDVVLLGGDQVADRPEAVSELQVLSRLQAPLGGFFVLGNHDLLGNGAAVRRALVSFGFTDATNSSRMIEKQGSSFELAAIDDAWLGVPDYSFGDPSTSLSSARDGEKPRVLLSHEPDALLDVKEGDASLVLSGHTHGGQIRLPFVGSIWPIPAKLGRAVDRGRKVIHGVPLIISNGLGETDCRARMLAPPQIVLVEIGI